MQHFILILSALSLVLVSSPVSFAVIVSDEVGSHMTTPGVPAFGVNVDGVLQIGWEDFWFGSAALIADRYVLTAAHNLGMDNQGRPDPAFLTDLMVHFDLPSGPVEIPVVGAVGVPGWNDTLPGDVPEDIAVVELAADAPAEAPRYPLYGARNELMHPVVVVGYGVTGRGDIGVDDAWPGLEKRAGLNRYEAEYLSDDEQIVGHTLVYDFDSGLEANNSPAEFGMDSDLGFGSDEVLSVFGDSGGPMFLNGAIAAITAYLVGGQDQVPTDYTPEADGSWGELSLDTRVSSYRQFITDATDGQAVFVIPEPAAATLLLTGLLVVIAFRGNNRQPTYAGNLSCAGKVACLRSPA